MDTIKKAVDSVTGSATTQGQNNSTSGPSRPNDGAYYSGTAQLVEETKWKLSIRQSTADSLPLRQISSTAAANRAQH